MSVVIDGTTGVNTPAITGFTAPLSASLGGTNNNFFSVSGPTTSTKTYTFPNENMSVGYRNVPAVGAKTSNYTLAVGDVGKYVQVITGGSITIPTGVFAEGDVVLIVNNTASTITITCSALTTYVAGTDTIKISVILGARGFANIFFLSSSLCIVSGNVA